MIDNILSFLRESVIPLDVVRVALPATPYPSEAVMTIQYNASTGDITKTESGKLETWSLLPDSMHVLAPRNKEEMEAELSVAGWYLGAGYLFRWYHRTDDYSHHFRNRYSIAVATGENSFRHEDFTDDTDAREIYHQMISRAEDYGVWEWEFNVAYRRNIAKPWQFESWRKHDPSIDDEGKRAEPFPGWDGSFEFQTTEDPHNSFCSEYYYAMPKQYHADYNVLVKGLKHE